MENTNTKNKKHIFRSILIAILLIVIAILTIVYFINEKNSKYSIQYSSIEDKGNSFYLNIYIEVNKEISLNASDFSVMITGFPFKADKFIEGYFSSFDTTNGLKTSAVTTTVLKLTESKTVEVIFERTLSSIDSPAIFYYKGEKLELGKKLTFKV